MYTKYTAVVLAVLVAAAEANSITFKDKPVFELIQEEREDTRVWERSGLTANINSYLDSTISMLIPFIQNNGLDPLGLPDIEAGFQVKPVLITYSARVSLSNGRVSGLVNIGRSGNQVVSYYGKRLRVRLQVQFTDLEFVYRYVVKVMNIGPSGGIVGSLNRFTVAVEALFDFNTDQIHLQELSLVELGRIRVRLTGNFLIDWLATPLTNLFLRIFDDTIMNAVINAIRGTVQNALRNINNNLRETIRRLESFN